MNLNNILDDADDERNRNNEKTERIYGTAEQWLLTLYKKAHASLLAAFTGIEGLPEVTVTPYQPNRGQGFVRAVVSVRATGSRLMVSAVDTLTWYCGDGINIGRGESKGIVGSILDRQRHNIPPGSFTYNVGNLPHTGHYAVDASSLHRKLEDAVKAS